jgi:rRNA maturation endonuclease Nob1
MKSIEICPICGKPALLTIEYGPLEYKGVIYDIAKHFYRCEGCKEEFTTTEADELTLSQIPNSIWSKK